MNDTQLLCWGGLWKAFLAVRVTEEVNLRSPDKMRAEPFLRHLGKASRMLGWRRSLLKLSELNGVS